MESQAEIEQILYNEFYRLNVPHKSKQQITHVKIEYFEVSSACEGFWYVLNGHVMVELYGQDLHSAMRYVIANWMHSILMIDKKDKFTRFKGWYYLSVVSLFILSLVNYFGFFLVYPLISTLFMLIFIGLLIFSHILFLQWRKRMKVQFLEALHTSPWKYTEEEILNLRKNIFRSHYSMHTWYFGIYFFLGFVVIGAFLNYFGIL